MRKIILGVAAIGFMAFATSAHAGFILSTGTTGAIPSNNDFKSDLNALGFDSFSQGAGTDLKLSVGGTVVFFKHGDLAVDMDVNLFGGVTRRNLDDTFDWWRVVLDEVRVEMVE